MTKRALVTGASGFVGAVVARRLLADGHDVYLLVRPESDAWRLHGVDAPQHEVDLTDNLKLSTLLRSVRPEWIFHLATHGAYASQTDSRRMVETNVLGTMNLVEAALDLGFEALVNAGSSSEYGFSGHPPSEDERAEPNSTYALTKLSQTLFCRFAARQHDVHIPTLRLYSVYRPYEEPTRFVPTLIAHGLDRRLPPLASPDVARDIRLHGRCGGGIRPRRRAKRHRTWRHLERGYRDPNEAERRRPPRARDVRHRSRARMGDHARPCVGYNHVGRQCGQDRT